MSFEKRPKTPDAVADDVPMTCNLDDPAELEMPEDVPTNTWPEFVIRMRSVFVVLALVANDRNPVLFIPDLI